MKIDPTVLCSLMAVAFAAGLYVRGVIDSNYDQLAYYIRWAVYTVAGLFALIGILALVQGWRP